MEIIHKLSHIIAHTPILANISFGNLFPIRKLIGIKAHGATLRAVRIFEVQNPSAAIILEIAAKISGLKWVPPNDPVFILTDHHVIAEIL